MAKIERLKLVALWTNMAAPWGAQIWRKKKYFLFNMTEQLSY